MKNRLKCLFFIFAINLCGWVFDPVARGADYPAEPFRVALIRSSSMYLAAAMIQDQAMRESLSANTQRNVEFYVDDLDTMRFPSAEFEAQFLRLLRLKYQGRKIDLLMPVGPDALRFAQRYRADIWPGVPIVFYSVAEDSLQGFQLQPEATGIILPFDLPGTIELAIRLQANAKRIVVVSGTSNYDQNWLRRAREALRRYENRFDISYWINQRLRELLEALRKLPPDTIVLYLSFSRDADGDTFVPRDMARSFAEASSAPVYGILGTYIGQGIVGGSVPSFAAHGKLAGEIAMRVLSGQKAGEIPVQPSAAAVPTLDWRQLQRWNISESRLPPGAIVHFRPPSLWSEYKLYVIGVVAIVALQGLLIGSLLLQRSSRRRAEEERRTKEQALRFSEARYRAVVEDQTELICRFLPDGTYTFVNDAYCRYFQRSREELLGYSFWNFIPPEGHRAAREFLASITPERPIATREHEVLAPDGELRWQQWRDRGFFDDQGRVVEYQAVGRDITERKRAEQMLRENETALRASYDRIQDLAGRLITAQEAERSRIASDLHDDVNQQLAGLSIALSNVKQQLQNGGDVTVQEELTRLQQRTVDLADVIRNLSHELHPGVLQHVGLAAALNGHCAEVGRQHEIEVTFSAVDGLNGIPDDVALCLYRVAQEALRNVAAHAGARKAQVTLRSTDNGLELVIADDGQGFDLAEARHQEGLGLISLDERVRLVGGSLTIDTEPKRGTEVRVQVPLGGTQ